LVASFSGSDVTHLVLDFGSVEINTLAALDFDIFNRTKMAGFSSEYVNVLATIVAPFPRTAGHVSARRLGESERLASRDGAEAATDGKL
jgi:hypothetical protein